MAAETQVPWRRPVGNHPSPDPVALKVVTAVLVAPILLLLVLHVRSSWNDISGSLGELLAWTAALALLNVLEIPSWNGLALTPDIPLGVALSLLFPPLTAGLAALVGSLDREELLGRKSLVRALFNRGNQAVGITLASLAAHMLTSDPSNLSMTALACAVAQAVWTAESYLVAALGASLSRKIRYSDALRHLRLGKSIDVALATFVWFLMASLLVVTYDAIGLPAVVAFASVAILVRQMLVRSDSVIRKEAEVNSHRMTIHALSGRIAAERKDERMRIASHIHDEVIQPLFQVSLLCQVTSQDLVNERLTDLKEDLPSLVTACETASQNLRDLVKDLRASPIGLRGLASAASALAKDVQAAYPGVVSTKVDAAGALDPQLQLVAYQVCKEALMNAAHHSRAAAIEVRLSSEGRYLRLEVSDNGVGFDPGYSSADHFGLLIMQERTEEAGGTLYVDSSPGAGTTVTAIFPLREGET